MLEAAFLLDNVKHTAKQFDADDVRDYTFAAGDWEYLGTQDAPTDPSNIDGLSEPMALLRALNNGQYVLLPIRLIGSLSDSAALAFRHFALAAWNEWIASVAQQRRDDSSASASQ